MVCYREGGGEWIPLADIAARTDLAEAERRDLLSLTHGELGHLAVMAQANHPMQALIIYSATRGHVRLDALGSAYVFRPS
jgi:hypothetical protein